MERAPSPIFIPNTLRDINDITTTTTTTTTRRELGVPSASSSEFMDVNSESHRSKIRPAEPDYDRASSRNDSSNSTRITNQPLFRSVTQKADVDDEKSIQQQITNETLVNENDSVLGAAGYDPTRVTEIDTDAAYALQLQQEEYSRESLAINQNRFFPFQVEPDNELTASALPYLPGPDIHPFTNDEQLAAYLQAQEHRTRHRYPGTDIPYVPVRQRPNPMSIQTSEVDEDPAEAIPPSFARFLRHHSSNNEDDSDEDTSNVNIHLPFFQFLANRGRSSADNFHLLFPGYRGRGGYRRRSGNLQDTEEDFGPEDYERLLQLDDTVHKKKLTKDQINTLPLEQFRRTSNNTDEENKCGVCLDHFEVNQTLRRFPCRHVYHKECGDRWLQENNACPICREPPIKVQSTVSSRHHRVTNPMRRPSHINRSSTNRNNNTTHHRRGGPSFQPGTSTPKMTNNDNNNNCPAIRSVKAVKSTTSRIIPSVSLSSPPLEDHDYDGGSSCPSFDLHLYAHIDRSSLNRCVFTPVPHQTVSQDQQTSRKRKYESEDSTDEYTKNSKFGNDNGELADIIYNMDKRLDELTRTCNGLRSSMHVLTKMVTQLVNNQKQNTNINDFDDISQTRLPYVRSSTSVSSKRTSNKIKCPENITDIVSQRPTDFLCRLIRKAYSTDEIAAGITPDERLDRIKEAVAGRYFYDEPEQFETFWTKDAHQSILGQARAQRCRERKKLSYK
ncbi:unnamed protein product [Adineta steineri]|uniref:RING-type domain-containing protein n=1 Tax=Adineta steineri TaxID=433720 RepID=A0A814CSM2_9BILA|nr:unnamed protein product [Adineta steineri]